MKQETLQTAITSVRQGKARAETDNVVVEEPLEIVLAYYRDGAAHKQTLSITMRTPGNDLELVRGFLYCEGIIRRHSDIISLSHRGSQALKEGVSNVVLAQLKPTVAVNIERLQRNFTVNSACGVCGKASLEALENAGAQAVLNDSFSMAASRLLTLPHTARKLQRVFEDTGSAHAAAAFSSDCQITTLREDIGRHNAMDKLIGAITPERESGSLPLGVFVSGRASFELLQKAAMAGFPLFAAVGAPSSLAVELAVEFEITLVGFMREDKFNIYNRPDRVQF
jgi:FdhD protein